MADVYDAAYSPNLREAKRRGAIAMVHYPIRSYARTSAQPRDIRALGMGVIINPEGLANELVGASRDVGRNFARETLAAIDPAVPRDASIAIYNSVDVAVYGAPYSDCDESFAGLNDVYRPAGFQTRVYGEGAVIHHLLGQGLVQGKQWLSMSESFPGFDARSPDICLVQMHDGNGHWVGTDIAGTDSDHITTNPRDIGAWWPTGSPYATPGDTVSAADVITALKSSEGQKLLQDAIWGKKWVSPLDPAGKQGYSAAQYLVYAWEHAYTASSVAQKVSGQVADEAQHILNLSTAVTNFAKTTAFDASAAAAEVLAKLRGMLGGQS